MKNPINLDEIYNLEFEKVKNELKQYSIEKLQAKNGKKLFVKLRNLQMELVCRNDDLVRLKTSETSFMEDKYTIELTTIFKNNIDGYDELPITHFVEDYLGKLKLQFKKTIHTLPKNIKLNEKNTVILIANWYSTRLFIDKLNLINENETLERMIELINSDEIIILKNDKSNEEEKVDPIQAKNFENEFTTSRQVLAIKYLFKYAGIKENQYDKTKLAEFIRFLTGKEMGAVKIQNTTIYKKVLNSKKEIDAEQKIDLKYIKKLFSNLNLYSIVDEINKEIDN